MKLDDLVEELRKSGTSEFKLALLVALALAHPGLSLAGLLVRFAAHHHVTEGTVKKAREILARHEAKPLTTQAPSQRK